jgi:nicotinamide-nucleotide amidase
MNHHFELSQQLALLLQKNGQQLVVAESCTGGGLAAAITALPGASAWFERGFVTYSNEAKIELLGVRAETIEKFGAVSEETAAEMAAGALKNSHASISISITGIAGPSGGSPEKPVGTVCFGLAKINSTPKTHREIFKGSRHEIQACAITFALQWLIKEL